MGDEQSRKSQRNAWMTSGAGIAIGIVVGLALGFSLDNMGIGIAIGLAIIVAFVVVGGRGGRRTPPSREDRPNGDGPDSAG